MEGNHVVVMPEKVTTIKSHIPLLRQKSLKIDEHSSKIVEHLKNIVKQSFKIPKIGIISGSFVEEGRVIKNSLLRVLRENKSWNTESEPDLRPVEEDPAVRASRQDICGSVRASQQQL